MRIPWLSHVKSDSKSNTWRKVEIIEEIKLKLMYRAREEKEDRTCRHLFPFDSKY
jgi:hypothetical protein